MSRPATSSTSRQPQVTRAVRATDGTVKGALFCRRATLQGQTKPGASPFHQVRQRLDQGRRRAQDARNRGHYARKICAHTADVETKPAVSWVSRSDTAIVTIIRAPTELKPPRNPDHPRPDRERQMWPARPVAERMNARNIFLR